MTQTATMPFLTVDFCVTRIPMTEPLTDKELAQNAASGDQAAFSLLVQRHYRRALRVALGLLKDPHDAEDVVQEAFAKAHGRMNEFEGASSFYTWLYRIIVNLSIDQIRKKRRERRHLLDEDETTEVFSHQTAELWPKYDTSNPDEVTFRRQLGAQLNKALAELPEIHQAVVLLRELEGQSYDQIASILQIKKGTVMSRLFHARRGMQRFLSKQDEPADAAMALALPEGWR